MKCEDCEYELEADEIPRRASTRRQCKQCKYLISKYNIDRRERDGLWQLQTENGVKNVCPICSNSIELNIVGNVRNKAQLDHNHATQQVRGFTCRNCNTSMKECFDDSLHCFINSAHYLLKTDRAVQKLYSSERRGEFTKRMMELQVAVNKLQQLMNNMMN